MNFIFLFNELNGAPFPLLYHLNVIMDNAKMTNDSKSNPKST